MTDSLGKYLKGEREKRNFTLEKIHAVTKIRKEYLLALEEDRHDQLPAPLYVKGYLRSYARSLSLDEKEVLTRYEDHLKRLLPPEPKPVKQNLTIPPRKSKYFVAPGLAFAIMVTLTIFFISLNLRDRAEEKRSPQPSTFSVQPAVSVPFEGGLKAYEIIHPKEIPLNPTDHDPTPATLFEIIEAALGTEIGKTDDSQFLKEKVSQFTSNHQRGYFFTRVRTSIHGKITHVWLYEGKEYHRIEMEVQPPTWSVFSYLTFRPQHVGNWTAEARAGDQVLASLHFKVLQ